MPNQLCCVRVFEADVTKSTPSTGVLLYIPRLTGSIFIIGQPLSLHAPFTSHDHFIARGSVNSKRDASVALNFKGDQAWKKMKVDAEWIEENASDEKVINLAKSLLPLSENLPRMQEIILKEITPQMRTELEKLAKEVGQ